MVTAQYIGNVLKGQKHAQAKQHNTHDELLHIIRLLLPYDSHHPQTLHLYEFFIQDI